MMDFQTLFVYFSLLFLCVLVSCYNKKHVFLTDINLKIYLMNYLIIIIYSLIIGLRYDVGVDYLLYKNTFLNPNNTIFVASNPYGQFEPLFSLFIYFMNIFDIGYVSLFLFIAFLQILFLVNFLKNFPNQFPWVIYFFITSSTFFDSLNVMRQTAALFMFFCCLKYILNRNFAKYVLAICIISLFHKSVLLLLPCYFFFHKDFLPKRWVQFVIIICSFIFSEYLFAYLIEQLFPKIADVFSMYQYGSYLENRDDLFVTESADGLGVSKYYSLFTDLIIVFYSVIFKRYYKKLGTIIYNFYFIGASFSYLLFNSITLTRMNYSFISFKFIVIGLLTYLLFNKKETKYYGLQPFVSQIVGAILIVSSFVWFINGILRGTKIAPFEFVFQ